MRSQNVCFPNADTSHLYNLPESGGGIYAPDMFTDVEQDHSDNCRSKHNSNSVATLREIL